MEPPSSIWGGSIVSFPCYTPAVTRSDQITCNMQLQPKVSITFLSHSTSPSRSLYLSIYLYISMSISTLATQQRSRFRGFEFTHRGEKLSFFFSSPLTRPKRDEKSYTFDYAFFNNGLYCCNCRFPNVLFSISPPTFLSDFRHAILLAHILTAIDSFIRNSARVLSLHIAAIFYIHIHS